MSQSLINSQDSLFITAVAVAGKSGKVSDRARNSAGFVNSLHDQSKLALALHGSGQLATMARKAATADNLETLQALADNGQTLSSIQWRTLAALLLAAHGMPENLHRAPADQCLQALAIGNANLSAYIARLGGLVTEVQEKRIASTRAKLTQHRALVDKCAELTQAAIEASKAKTEAVA